MQPWRMLTVGLGSVVAFVALLTPIFAAAADTQWLQELQERSHNVQRASLRGLTGVMVFISGFDNLDVARNGLTTAQVQTDVELRLRMAGLKVWTLKEIVASIISTPPKTSPPEEDLRSLGRRGTLDITVNLVKHARYPVYAVTINVRLFQQRDQNRPADTTWDRYLLDTIDSASLYSLRETVRNFVDEFINDYLSVNPRPAPVALPPTTTPMLPSSRRDLIHQVQERLQAAGFSPGTIDGAMGPQTREALRWFQNTQSLIPTGEIDEKTLDALGVR